MLNDYYNELVRKSQDYQHNITLVLDNWFGATNALCTIFTILLAILGQYCNAQMLHSSGVYYSYMVSGPNYEFRRHPELALKTGILVPKVVYDLPEF